MALDDWQGMRKVWTKARDSAKPSVGMGAVKGVSMGKAIDGVYAGAKKDYKALKTAIDTLLIDSGKYQAVIKKKNAPLATWLEKNVDLPAKKLREDVKNDTGLLKHAVAFYGNFNMKDEAWFPSQLTQLSVRVATEGKPMEQIANKEYLELVDATMFYLSLARMVGETATGLKVDLPVGDLRKKLIVVAGRINTPAKNMRKVMEASSHPADFDKVWRPHVSDPSDMWQAAADGWVLISKALGGTGR